MIELKNQLCGKVDTGGFIEGWCAEVKTEDGDGIEQVLTHSDCRLGALISLVRNSVGTMRFKPSNAASHFDALARSIVYQQLSKKAAANIYARYVGIFVEPPQPEQVLAVQPELLRQAGLSTPKVRYIRALASAIVSGELSLTRIGDQPDDAVIEYLTAVPGVGIWTAQMFLMFRLHRLDVLPVADVGVQRGLQIAHGLRQPAAPGYVERTGRRWAPFRSIACLYLWAAVDLGFSLDGNR